MHPLEFFALGLTPGQEVRLVLHPNQVRRESAEIRCFFRNYSVITGPSSISSPEDLIPVFVERTPGGKMSSKIIPQPTLYHHIKAVYPVSPNDMSFCPVSPSEVQAYNSMEHIHDSRAERTAIAIIREMAALFPDKEIVIGREKWVDSSFSWGSHSRNGEIISVRVEKDTVLFTIADDFDTYKIEGDDLNVTDPCHFLSALFESITNPDDDPDYDKETFIDLGASWNDIPEPEDEETARKTPLLHRFYLLDTLRANLWFDELLNDEKRLQKEMEHFEEEIEFADGLTFPEKASSWWSGQTNEFKALQFRVACKD